MKLNKKAQAVEKKQLAELIIAIVAIVVIGMIFFPVNELFAGEAKESICSVSIDTVQKTGKGTLSCPRQRAILMKGANAEKGDLEYTYEQIAKQMIDCANTIGYPPKEGEKFDTIYVDLSGGDITAYCETTNICELDEQDKKVDVSSREFILETPFDVLEEAKYGTVLRKEMVEGKDATVVEYDVGSGNTKIVWLWNYRGIPLKYEVRSSSDEKLRAVVFGQLTINDVDDDELSH